MPRVVERMTSKLTWRIQSDLLVQKKLDRVELLSDANTFKDRPLIVKEKRGISPICPSHDEVSPHWYIQFGQQGRRRYGIERNNGPY